MFRLKTLTVLDQFLLDNSGVWVHRHVFPPFNKGEQLSWFPAFFSYQKWVNYYRKTCVPRGAIFFPVVSKRPVSSHSFLKELISRQKWDKIENGDITSPEINLKLHQQIAAKMDKKTPLPRDWRVVMPDTVWHLGRPLDNAIWRMPQQQSRSVWIRVTSITWESWTEQVNIGIPIFMNR